MKPSRSRLVLLSLIFGSLVLSAGGCPVGYIDLGERLPGVSTGATSGSGGGTGTGGSTTTGAGGDLGCTPGETAPCYDGPKDTLGVGLCKAGTKTCTAEGTSFGPCQGQVLPVPEDCATPFDEDCDGKAPACSGTLTWAKRFGDALGQDGTSVAVDSAGDVIVAGNFQGQIDFGGGLLTTSGNTDIFVAKLDPNGNHLWSKRLGGMGDQYAGRVTVDSAGNVILIGSFQGQVDFGGGMFTSEGKDDIFVVKLDAAGNHLWSKRFGDLEEQAGIVIAADGGGNLILTGTFRGQLDLGGAPLNAAGGGTTMDTFVAKLGPDGAHLWSKRLGTMNVYAFPAVTVDSGGNVIAADPFLGQVDLGGGLLTSQGSQDIFVVKFDPGGAHLWSKRFGDEKDQSGCILKADSAGNLILVGVFAGQIDLGGGALIGAGSNDTFLVKLDPNGGHLWSQRFGAPNQTTSSSDLAVDPTGSILLAGGFTGQVNFGGWSLVSAGKKDIFLMKLTAGGAPVWSRSFGDAAEQSAYGIATDGTGNVFVVGDLNNATDFGQGALVSAGSSDVFVAKFTP